MPRKKGKPIVNDTTWEQIRTLYVFGRHDVESKQQVYPSMGQLAKEFDLPTSTIGSRARKGEWLQARDTAKDRVVDEQRRRTAERIINSLAELNDQDLIILDGQIELYVENLLAGTATVSTSEVIKALAFRRKIYEDIFGVSKEKPVGVEVNVGVGVQMDFNNLSDYEQEAIYDVVAASQIREKRSAERDALGKAETGDVPPLDT